jgi:hypothetical protein
MIKRYKMFIGFSLLGLLFVAVLYAQPQNGENEYRLGAVNPRFTGIDSIDADAGRGVWVAHDPDLDGDGKPEILVTDYSNGGRIFVYEVVGDDQIEFVWASKILSDSSSGGGSTPRSVITGDFDNNGKQEIIFTVGYFTSDSANRGIYFYEYTGNDNDYGSEPIYKMTYESIDPGFADASVGRQENGLMVRDIDGDGRNEFLFPSRTFSAPELANLYIMQVTSGSFADGNAVIENEYTYTDMANALPPDDGYVPYGTDIGDVDNNGTDEIIVGGWVNYSTGVGLGFIQINGPDSYTPGNTIQITDQATCCVKYKPLFTKVNDAPVIYVSISPPSATWVVEGIVSYLFVSPTNVHKIHSGDVFWSAWDLGDQDHPTNDPGDGIDLYAYGGGGNRLNDIEFDETGSVTDSNSYSVTEMYDLAAVYDTIGGLFNDVYTYPGMDIDNDGLRDIVVSYKGWAEDSLAGVSLAKNGFHIFLFEWGDSTQSVDLDSIVTHPTGFKMKALSIITPGDYILDQNYPNPFNPTTNIKFTLPISKNISLKIYNTLGQEVRTLINDTKYPPGGHIAQWDGKDNNGNNVASGVYVYTLIFGNFSKSNKMTLIR